MSFLDESVKMDDKCVYSHGVYILVTVIAVVASAAMEILCGALYLVSPEIGLAAFTFCFYPTAIGILITFFYTIPELIRNIYLSSVLALVLAIILAVLLVTAVILQETFLGQVYIIPFKFL